MTYPGAPLQRESRGDAVKAIQARLGVQQTGIFGPTTEENVMAFQRSHGLTADGVVGPRTWAALFSDTLAKALAFTIKWEGGFVDDPDDPGGATNQGITQGTYNAYRDSIGEARRSVRQITDGEVQSIYEERYWDAAGCGGLGAPLAVALFDTAVNFGIGGARRLLARAGEIEDPGELAARLVRKRIERRQELVEANPKLAKFLKGWLNRDRELGEYIETV